MKLSNQYLQIAALMLAPSLAASITNDDIDFADAKYQCYRSLRAFVREVHPDHVFVPSSQDNWKPVKSLDKDVLKIEVEDYIKIKMNSKSGFKSHKAFCSYHKPTMSVISIDISKPK